VRLVLLPVLAATAVAGCGGAEAVGTWQDEQGRTVESSAGPEHCDWESATFLYVEVDLDELGIPADRQQFLRDPEGVLSDSVELEYDGDARLPRGAVDTGLRLDARELWAEPADDPPGPDAVYVVEGDSVERWPRTREEVACA
jgi:hypothetical protein